MIKHLWEKEPFFPRLITLLPAVKISGVGTSQDDDSQDVVNPFSTTCVGEASGGAALELCTQVSNSSDTSSEIEESELGEFLLDTFHAMEASGNLLAHLEMP